MTNVKSVTVENQFSKAQTTLLDKMPTEPILGPQGMKAIGPRITFHFISDEWNKANTYESYDVVNVGGASYVAIRPVPAGIELDNTNYWFYWSGPNAQFADLLDKVNAYAADMDEANALVQLSIRNYSNVSEMKGDTYLKVGEICHTEAFNTEYGSAFYIISASGIDDGYTYIQLNNGNFAKLIKTPMLEPQAFGGTDTAAINRLLAFMQNDSDIHFPSGTYTVNDEIIISGKNIRIFIDSDAVIEGDGSSHLGTGSLISFYGTRTVGKTWDNVTEEEITRNVEIHGGVFSDNDATGETNCISAGYFVENITIEGVTFKNANRKCFAPQQKLRNVTIKNCIIDNCVCGLEFTYCENVNAHDIVINCDSSAFANVASDVQPFAVGSYNSKNVNIKNITANGYEGKNVLIVSNSNTANNKIENFNSDGGAIRITAGNTNINNCQFDNCGTSLLSAYESSIFITNTIIGGSVINGSNGQDIYISNCDIDAEINITYCLSFIMECCKCKKVSVGNNQTDEQLNVYISNSFIEGGIDVNKSIGNDTTKVIIVGNTITTESNAINLHGGGITTPVGIAYANDIICATTFPTQPPIMFKNIVNGSVSGS